EHLKEDNSCELKYFLWGFLARSSSWPFHPRTRSIKCRFMACTIVTPTPAVGRHTEHDHVRYDNHWIIDPNMNGTCDPSVNVAVLSFVNPGNLMNLHLPYSDRNLCSAPAMKRDPWLRLTAG